MQDERFEWNDRKAASNLRKHDVSFELARLVFDDPNAIEEPDDDPDEDRWKRIGISHNRVLLVVYVTKSEKIRIISARKANRHEQERYFRQT